MLKKMMTVVAVAGLVLALAPAAQAAEGEKIDPAELTATASSEHEWYYGPEYAVNGAGLYLGTFPDEIHHGGHHSGVGNSAEQQWLSLEPTDDTPNGTWFKVDLGGLYALDYMIFWNGSFRGGTSGLGTTDSLEQGDIYYSSSETDPGSDFSQPAWTAFGTPGTRIFTPNPGTSDFGPTETINFGFDAQWFAIDVNSNYGADAWTAIAEMQFIGTPTEPDPDLPGDPNGDGFVDDDDLAVMLSNWEQDPGTISTWALGDFTGDTDVDDDDLAVLLGNWTGSPPGGAAVPEPVSAILLLLGAPLAALRRRRR